MNKCENCQHWNGLMRDGYQGSDTGHGSCKVLTSSEGKVDGKALAYVLDGEHYTADLYCKADFGCKMWEAR